MLIGQADGKESWTSMKWTDWQRYSRARDANEWFDLEAVAQSSENEVAIPFIIRHGAVILNLFTSWLTEIIIVEIHLMTFNSNTFQ